MSIRPLVPVLIMLCTACASHDGLDKPTPEANEPTPPAVVAKASIASVQMIENCPEQDPKPAAKPTKSPVPAQAAAEQSMVDPGFSDQEKPAAGAPARMAAGSPPPSVCTQSTMQLAFTGQGDAPGPVEIKSIAMLSPDKSVALGRIEARVPTSWQNDKYEPWDGVIPARSDLKASYRISVPDWSALEKKLGKGSYGTMFVLEVVLEIDGQEQTIRSPEFPREEPHVIVT